MKKHWSDKAKGLDPYEAGEQPRQQMVKLNTNENAYPPSPQVLKAVLKAGKNLRLYPQPNSDQLCKVIADQEGLNRENVFCSNGSDEALAFAFAAFYNPESDVRTMDVTYSFYPVWAQFFDIELHTVPLREDYTVDVEGMSGAEGVILANPNAPTGIALPLADVEHILESTNGVVIVDEAYVAFGAESAARLIPKYDNLLVVRTLSKSHSLAGLRVGYAMGHVHLIHALEAVKDSFNSYPLDMLAQAGAAAALQDTVYNQTTTSSIMRDREGTRKALTEMGLTVLPSSTNFLFVHCDNAATVFDQLREKRILVRYFHGGRTADFLRVTIGTTEQMAKFLQAMEEIID